MQCTQNTEEMATNLEHTVDEVIDLCDLIYGADASEESTAAAADAIYVAIDEAVERETAELRGALEAMVANHRHRFPLTGMCHCEACEYAEQLIGGRN